jgi:hypothetical protein
MTTNELINYYANLLILQYVGKPRAYATVQLLAAGAVLPQTSVQKITFPSAPASGAFTLRYDGVNTASIAWNALTATVQTDLRAITGLENVTVLGSIAAQSLTIIFTDVPVPAKELTVSANTLVDGSAASIVPVITEIDDTLPVAVQNAFNLNGDDTAVGVQLDTIAKYVGVTRSGNGLDGQPITLDDTDFLTLIRLAALTNSAGSSLETITTLLYQFFQNQILLYDYANMRFSYILASTIGSSDLIQLFLTEGLLPKPMGVQLSVVVVPTIDVLFGFRTYLSAAGVAKPFNRYGNWNFEWRWLSYADRP